MTEEAKALDRVYNKKIGNVSPIRSPNDRCLSKISMLSEVVMDWRGWLKEGSFYVHGVVYMMVRLAVNVTMTV